MIGYLLEPLAWFVTKRYLYHLDKLAHTAALAFGLAAASALVHHPVTLTRCAIWAAAGYFILGKLIWYTSASYRRNVERAYPSQVNRPPAGPSFLTDGLKPGDKVAYVNDGAGKAAGKSGLLVVVTVAAYELRTRPTWWAYVPGPSLDWFSDAALSWAVVMLAATYEGHWRLALVSLLLSPPIYLYAVATRRTSP